ncbi:ABC-type Fe3+-siderophore transport system, permease component [Halobacteroides halobius DSM 5150]|uniref:ABC-type Fe3+-siderophore transport system, permease component n=1 Tax=Halobacteroides halobius (strain ATCC 35273 / DSM 5150 / MD-1) TaxID=748449 RepID=L0KCT7_HALHC|nr:iron ABC transporter permease [Halobacteroides halobius]AGB42204.1 ABC-type Fe3+-siderophore transport system, permease component [Halobacteroides halobius DSM 5150]
MDKYTTFRNKSGSISFQINKKTITVLSLLSCLMLVMLIIGLSIGSTMINPLVVLKHLLGAKIDKYAFIINILRLPRILLALLVGAALGVSGLILQGTIRNPLASPNIIGITGGASAAAVLFISYFSKTLSIKWLPLAAIIGAGIVSFIIYTLAWKEGVTPIRLVLIGIGMAAAMNALTTLMIVLSPIATTIKSYTWLTGSVYGANWTDVYAMLPWVIVFIPLALLFSRILNVQELGDQVAYSLGVRVQFYRFSLLFISVALAGSAVAFAGGIGFVGLIAPHIARKLVGRSFAALVPTSAMIGGLTVFLADLIARTLFLPLDLPAGVFVSGIGAPFFIYLLYINRNRV